MEQYCEQKHNKVTQIYPQRKICKMICTQTEKFDIYENNEDMKINEKMGEQDKTTIYYCYKL